MSAIVITDGAVVELISESATVTLSDHVVGADVDNTAAPVDVGTFGQPNRQRPGRVQTNLTLQLLWSEDLLDLLEPIVGVDLTMQLQPTADGTKSVQVPCIFATLPFGAFTLGERVETDLQLAVLGDVDWAAILS